MALPDYEPALDRLDEIIQLDDGWDGEGSLKPTVRTFASVHSLLQCACLACVNRPMLSVSSTGAISLHWKNGKTLMVVMVFGFVYSAHAYEAGAIVFSSRWELGDRSGIYKNFLTYMKEHFKFQGEENGVDCKS